MHNKIMTTKSFRLLPQICIKFIWYKMFRLPHKTHKIIITKIVWTTSNLHLIHTSVDLPHNIDKIFRLPQIMHKKIVSIYVWNQYKKTNLAEVCYFWEFLFVRFYGVRYWIFILDDHTELKNFMFFSYLYLHL